MTPHEITAEHVHQTLRAIRAARPLADSPLLEMDALSGGLGGDQLADSPSAKASFLPRWLGGVVWDQLCLARGQAAGAQRPHLNGTMASSRRPNEPPKTDFSSLAEDFRSNSVDREAWGLLHYYYFSGNSDRLHQLAASLHLGLNTARRRLDRGYQLLADALIAREREATVPSIQTAPPDEQSLTDRRLTEYRLGRVVEWSQPRYRLDRRFVALTLLMDRGEDTTSDRWAAREERYDDLGTLLASVHDPAVVVLGPPGSGKSTLLRHLELNTATANLHGEDPRDTVTFFIQLNRYKSSEHGKPLPSPESWLAERWAAANPGLPPLSDLLAAGRMILLLDALNEMPAASESDRRECIGRWKDWLVQLATEKPGNRVVFSCRTLDYSAPLSTPSLRVPQVQIEPLRDEQVNEFLQLYGSGSQRDIWTAITGSPLLEALRVPFFLSLLVDQVEATGEITSDRASLFTSLVRRTLKREIERDNPLFFGLGRADRQWFDAPAGNGSSEDDAEYQPDATRDAVTTNAATILSERDVRRIVQRQWKTPYELPEQGTLVPKLGTLAYRMQEAKTSGEASQVRVAYETALDLLDHPQGEAIVKAGIAINVLDEDPAADEVLFVHQLLQEYFAARVLARAPEPELVAAPWRAAQIKPGLREILDALPTAEALPALPATGWEETTLLAAAMVDEPEPFIRGLMPHSLVIAGKAANLPTVRPKLSASFLDELRWALVVRSRDREADLRARIDAGLTLGWLGDPRFERREGPYGVYLVPPMVAIPGGEYPIGENEPINVEGHAYTDHIPRHTVALGAFAIGKFAVTNAEYACFIAAGGYDQERWWETEGARAWRNGEGTAEGTKRNNRWWWREFQAQPQRLTTLIEEGRLDDMAAELWQRWAALDEAEYEAVLTARWPEGRLTEPLYWHDSRYNHPAQPVVGVCWYEARAYCAWLIAQTGLAVSLPTEVEREAATRGSTGRNFAYGGTFYALGSNTFAAHVQQPSPVGVFVEGDTPEGASDLAGNSLDWTISLYGRSEDEAEYRYPYDAADGREDDSAGADQLRVVRGGSWYLTLDITRAAFRNYDLPVYRGPVVGFRLRSAVPLP